MVYLVTFCDDSDNGSELPLAILASDTAAAALVARELGTAPHWEQTDDGARIAPADGGHYRVTRWPVED